MADRLHRITIAGTDLGFDCAAGDTILRAGLRAGLGLPYECGVGSCGTCRIELDAGELATLWEAAPGLSERDKARGRRLACQSRALGPCTIRLRPSAEHVPPVRPRRRLARLVATRALTADMVEFSFATEGPADFVPGQYALLEFGAGIGARAYSMANLPNPAGEWRFVIRRVPEGLASAVLFGGGLEVRAIELDAPYGLAYLRATPRDVLCVAGGSGLSPMLSIIRAAASDPHFAGRRLHLYYGGRAPADLCAETEISGLPGFGTTLLHRAAVSDPEAATRAGYGGPQGFIHAVVEAAFGDALRDHEIYFAGPPAMADAMQKMLVLTRKVPVGQVHFDRFY